jgi:hypothetical protein
LALVALVIEVLRILQQEPGDAFQHKKQTEYKGVYYRRLQITNGFCANYGTQKCQTKRRHKVTQIVMKNRQFLAKVAFAAALLFVCGLVPASQEAGAGDKRVATTPVSGAEKPEQRAMTETTPADPVEKYATCSPDYSGREIFAMEQFLSAFSPELVEKMKPILLKCDFKVNDQLLTTVAAVKEEKAETEFANAEQEKEFLQAKGKEIAVQIVLSQQPVDRTELKKLLEELFEIRQNGMKSELASLEKQAALLKKRIDERKKLKDRITDRKAKELTQREHPKAAGKGPVTDPLAWD